MLLLGLLGCTGPAPEEACAHGDVCRVAGTGQLGFNGEALPALESWLYFPSTVRIHPDGRLVVVDFNNMRVRALDADGTLVTIAGSGDHAWSTPGLDVLASALENPVDIVFGTADTYYVDALHEARILWVGPDGMINPIAGTGDPGYAGDEGPASEALLSEAAGLALGADGTLYIADTDNNCIRTVTPDGVIHTLAGAADAGFVDGAALDARFDKPQRLALADDTLFVADANNNAIRRIDLADGTVTTVAGTGTAGYTGDGGAATEATLTTPYGLDIAADGALYIADSGNNVIRRVDADGTITTIAGSGEEDLGPDETSAADAHFSFPAHVVLAGDDLYVADFKHGIVWQMVGATD